MQFFDPYPSRKTNTNIGERITSKCVELEDLMNMLEPQIVMKQHLFNLKQALFHSHSRVVSVAVKQLIRLASDILLAEQLSEDMEVVLGLIENLAHKQQKIARDCVMILLLLTSTPKALRHLLCPDITNALKTIMTYVAVRLLVYEFIIQLSINSPLGLEKSHSCGILEDIINDWKAKESYLTAVHEGLLHRLWCTPHGHSHLVKYGAADTVPRQPPSLPADATAHLITIVPTPIESPISDMQNSNQETDQLKKIGLTIKLKQSGVNTSVQLAMTNSFLDQLHQTPNSPRDISGPVPTCSENCQSSVGELSSVSSPCDSVASSSAPTSKGLTDYSASVDVAAAVDGVSRLVSSMRSVAPHLVFNHHPGSLATTLRALASSTNNAVLLALQVVGYIGSTTEGKRLLYRLSKRDQFMELAMKKILSLLIDSSTEFTTRTLNILHNLINVSESNVKYEKISRKWFRMLGRPVEVLRLVASLCSTPPEPTQLAALRLLRCLCTQPWARHYLNATRGLVDMLLTSAHNESRIVREVKDSTLQALLDSPMAGHSFKHHTLVRVHNYN